jgi:uncharacterized protein (TIGR03437 family)
MFLRVLFTMLFAGASLFAGTLAVGSGVASSSSNASVNVTYTAGGTQATMLQFDLTFDSTVLLVTGTGGSAASSAGKNLQTSPDATNANVMHFMLFGLNQNVIGDGVVVVLNIGVRNASYSGTQTLQISAIVAATTSGPSVTGTNGTVRVGSGGEPSPSVPSGGVTNGASFDAVIAPGAFISVFGTSLAPSSVASTGRGWVSSDFQGMNLPTKLDNYSVTINGKPGYFAFIRTDQLNVLAPNDTGDDRMVAVQVLSPSGNSSAVSVKWQKYAPAFFCQNVGGKYYLAGPARGVRPGAIIELWGTGFGPTNPAYPEGQILSPGAPYLLPTGAVTIKVGSATAQVVYAGLAYAGVYQINIVVPSLPDGDYAVVATIAGYNSPDAKAYLTIKN